MKITVKVGRTFPGKQYANYRPEFTLEQDAPEHADAETISSLMDDWRALLDTRLEKAEEYWSTRLEKNQKEQTF